MKVVSPSPAPANPKATSAEAGTASSPHGEGARPMAQTTKKNDAVPIVARTTAQVSSPRTMSGTPSGVAIIPS